MYVETQSTLEGGRDTSAHNDCRHFVDACCYVQCMGCAWRPSPSSWNHVSAIAGLTATQCLFLLHEGSIKRKQVVECLNARMSGYRQNVVVSRELVKGEPCGYEDLPIDGIVELWFEDAATLEAAFASHAGQVTMAHAKTFLHEITAFLVAERKIL